MTATGKAAPEGAAVTDEEVDGATYTDRDKLLVYAAVADEMMSILLGRESTKEERIAFMAPLVREKKRDLLARRKAARQ